MKEPVQTRKREGPVTVLALLVALLLGVTSGPVQASPDRTGSRLASGDLLRTGSVLRVAARSGEESPDAEDGIAILPPAPRVETQVAALYDIAAPVAAAAAPLPSGPLLAYRARAPPAA